MLSYALACFFVAATATSSDDAAYTALVQRQEAFREACYARAPAMPQTLAAGGLPALTARDARIMDLPDGASGEARMLLVVSDRDDVQDALLTGDWRGGTALIVELTAGVQAFDTAATTLYDLHEKAQPAPDTHAGAGSLQVFDAACSEAKSIGHVRSGYVSVSPTADNDLVHVRLNLGWGPGQTLKGEVAARWMLRPAHVHGHQGPTCSPAFSALSTLHE